MNCSEAQHQIDRWSPEGGKATLPAELAAHLVACTPCAEYSRDRMLSVLVRSVSDTRVPAGLEQRILDAGNHIRYSGEPRCRAPAETVADQSHGRLGDD